MSGRRSRPGRARIAVAGLVACAGAAAGCSEVASNVVETQPYRVEPIEGSDVQRVLLDDATAARVDLRTATVRDGRGRTFVPHASLIYNPEGDAYVYTRPAPQTYQRARVRVRRVDGDRATLSDGPPAGTVVVTLGAAELLATEYEILNQHP